MGKRMAKGRGTQFPLSEERKKPRFMAVYVLFFKKINLTYVYIYGWREREKKRGRKRRREGEGSTKLKYIAWL